jgi:thiol-disulfide isomerase/thioredoxin
LKDVKADVVLVEILNVYCPSCQEQAPIYNKLYDLIENDSKTKGQIKMLGVAIGNRDWEIEEFRNRYQIPFPVVPDPDFEVLRAVGGRRTPFSIYVRQDPSGKTSRVAGTHTGTNYRYDDLFNGLAALMTVDQYSLSEKGQETEPRAVYVEPILSQGELRARVKAVFESLNGEISKFEKVPLEGSRRVYTGLLRHQGRDRRLFAEVVSRPSLCDVCHNVHFIYVFDPTGKVIGFVPLQLTKYGNEPFGEAGLGKIRSQILGKYVFEPFVFDPDVDAVSSATITSAVIYDSFSQGKTLFERLKKVGLIK